MLVKDAHANNIQKVQICGDSIIGFNNGALQRGMDCVGVEYTGERDIGNLQINKQ